MPWFPAVPPALAAADGACRINKKQRAGLPRLLHKLFIKVLRLRPAAVTATAEEYYGAYGRTMGMGGATDDEECCYYYSYGSSWAGVLSSIPEEDDYDDDDSSDSEEGTPEPDVVVPGGPAVLRKAKSEQFLVGPHDAATTVVQLEVLL